MDHLPRNVTIEALALSPAEMRAFPRWYTNLLLRKHADSVTIGDVTAFVDNFGINQTQKQNIEQLFGEKLVTIDPLQFYIYLRLVGHILQGKHVRRELAYVAAPVPKPKSILAKKATEELIDPPSFKTDMDSFMSLMTGNHFGTPGGRSNGVHKRKKRVTFDSKPPQISEAAHRSMEELLRQSQIQEQYERQQPHPHIAPPSAPSEPEPDQPIANNQFAHVNIDSVLHNGKSMLPEPPAPRKTKAGDSFIQQLTQTTQSLPAARPANPQHHDPQHTPQHFPHSQSHLQPHAHPRPPLPRTLSQSAVPWPTSSPLPPGPPPPRQKLGPQSTGSLPVTLQPQLQPQLTAPAYSQPLSQQLMAPQTSGLSQQISPQLSGIMVQVSGPPSLPSQLSGQLPNQLPVPFANQFANASMAPAHISPQVSGPPVTSGMQFVNAVQNPPNSSPDYTYGQAYNMQGLRNQMPNW